MTTQDLISTRELDCRTSGTADVRLLWHEARGDLAVAVVDRISGDAFTVDVPPGASPLEVFHHPYAYAA